MNNKYLTKTIMSNSSVILNKMFSYTLKVKKETEKKERMRDGLIDR